MGVADDLGRWANPHAGGPDDWSAEDDDDPEGGISALEYTIRRSLLGLAPEYTLELVWLAAQYGFASKEAIDDLARTSTIRVHLRDHLAKLEELRMRWV